MPNLHATLGRANLDTTIARLNLDRIAADLMAFGAKPDGFRERTGRLSRLASEITAAYEAAYALVVQTPD